MEIIEYKSIWSREDIDKRVNEMIKDGWKPYGGLSLAVDETDDVLTGQAMVKYEESEESK